MTKNSEINSNQTLPKKSDQDILNELEDIKNQNKSLSVTLSIVISQRDEANNKLADALTQLTLLSAGR